MIKKKQIFISLGSNQGDRLVYLIKALCLLEAHKIKVIGLSRVYETPPWGFESTPFYNACAQLHTDVSPQELMQILLKVEKYLGRTRTKNTGYAARSIDLDLLCFEEVILNSDILTLPHPRLVLRNFVLQPLEEISKEWIHPALNKTVSELRQQSSDTAVCKPFPFSFWSPPIFKTYPYIPIEGNIGIGKSTLAQQIKEQYSVELYSERFTNNPYLPLFYKDPQKYALEVETFFLNDRVEQMVQFWKEEKASVVSDYFIYKSLVFAAQNLTSLDFKSYEKQFSSLVTKLNAPSLLVYLQADISHLMRQIKKRGRPFEQEIKEDYLRKIDQGYENLMQTNFSFPVVKIEVDELNFEADATAFQCILRKIYATTFL